MACPPQVLPICKWETWRDYAGRVVHCEDSLEVYFMQLTSQVCWCFAHTVEAALCWLGGALRGFP